MVFSTINIKDTNTVTRCILIFFLVCIIPGITTPISIYLGTNSYYDYWKPLYSLSIVSYMTSTWFCIHCLLGCFLILVKTCNKIIATLFSLSLLAVLAGTIYCVLYSQLSEIDLTIPENYFVHGLNNYFSENENIPDWLQQIQSKQKCCGISGPKDWLELIYPPDKPAIEDVPISCCMVKAIGCNFIFKDVNDQAELSKWIYTGGCRISIQVMIQGLMNYIMYWSVPISILTFLLLIMFWYEVNTFKMELMLLLSEQNTTENSMVDVDDIIKRNYSYDLSQDRINFTLDKDKLIEESNLNLQQQEGKNVSFFTNNTFPKASSMPRKSILASTKSSSTSNTFDYSPTRRGAVFKASEQ